MAACHSQALAAGLRAPLKINQPVGFEFQLSAHTELLYNRYLEYIRGETNQRQVNDIFMSLHGVGFGGNTSFSIFLGPLMASIQYRHFFGGQSYSASGKEYTQPGQVVHNPQKQVHPTGFDIFFHNQEISAHIGTIRWSQLRPDFQVGLQLEAGLGHRQYADRMSTARLINVQGGPLGSYDRATFYTYPTVRIGLILQYTAFGIGGNLGFSQLLFGENHSGMSQNPDLVYHAQSDGQKWEAEAHFWFNLFPTTRASLTLYYSRWWIADSDSVIEEQTQKLVGTIRTSLEPENTTEQIGLMLSLTYAFAMP